MDIIYNATQHTASPTQQAEGIRDLSGDRMAALHAAITLPWNYSRSDLYTATRKVQALVSEQAEADGNAVYGVMIGGLPALMSWLEENLASDNVRVGYARSARESVDTAQPDGSVRKVATFVHKGMYWIRSSTFHKERGATAPLSFFGLFTTSRATKPGNWR